MSAEQLRELLSELSLFSDFSQPAIGLIAAAAELVEVAAGTVLFREGTLSQKLFLVHSGAVALEMCVPGRGCLRLLTLGPGELVGWSSILGRSEMTTSAVITRDAQLIAVSAPTLLQICQSNHDVGYAFMQRLATALSRRLLATRLQLLDLYSNEQPVIKS